MREKFKGYLKGLFNSRIAIVVIIYILFFAILGHCRSLTVKNIQAKPRKVHRKPERSKLQEEIYTTAMVYYLHITNCRTM